MNVFIKSIQAGKITDEQQLKRLFWTLAKRLHPDAASVESNESSFIRLKNDYDEALKFLATEPLPEKNTSQRQPDFDRCTELFTELMARNFPIDRRARVGYYLEQVNEMNAQVGLFGPEYKNLFLDAEEELYRLKGTTTVSNHIFNLIKLYLYNVSDYFCNRTLFPKIYIEQSYSLVIDCLREKNAPRCIEFLNWLVKDLADRQMHH